MDAPCEVVFPPNIRFGAGACECIGEILQSRQLKKCLVVTDRGIVKAGIVEKALAPLRKSGIDTEVFSEVVANPPTETVRKGIERFSKSKSDCLVAVGGGSSIDTAKAIGVLATNGGEIMDYEGVSKVGRPLPFLVAIPTTYGSGSEVTAFMIITDEKRKFKAAIGSPYVMPQAALIDPEFMVALPAEIGAAVGLDALCHATESYTSRLAQPFSRALAFGAIRLISRNIRPAVNSDNDLEATLQMALASTMAGMAFSQSRLGNVHAMAHPLGGHFDVPHGTANALLLPYVMEFNMIAVPEKFKEIAEAMEVAGSSDDDAARKGVAAVRELQTDFNVPTRMSQLGVTEDSIACMARDAMLSGNVKINPRQTSLEDIVELYMKAL